MTNQLFVGRQERTIFERRKKSC